MSQQTIEKSKDLELHHPAREASNGKYNDIIQLARPISTKYPHMSIASRAAQFAPYKTITIYHDQIDDVEAKSSNFQESEIIPNEDYFEYTEDFDYPDLDEDFADATLGYTTDVPSSQTNNNQSLDNFTD